jgi:hypothetical protein
MGFPLARKMSVAEAGRACRDAGERALRLVSRGGDEALHVFAMFELAQTHQMRGALRHAANTMRAGLQVSVTPEALCQFGLRPTVVRNARANLAWVLGELGDFDEAITYGTEGVRLGAASGIPTNSSPRGTSSATSISSAEMSCGRTLSWSTTLIPPR